MRQVGLFGLSEHLKQLLAHGDPREELGRIIDFETFRPVLIAALAYGDGAKGARPPYDPVAMLKVLVLAAQNNVSDARMEYLIRERRSWLRFLGFDLDAQTPDANTIRLFREMLTEAGALDMVFADFDWQLEERGYLAMGGRSSMRPWWLCPSSATPRLIRTPSRRARPPARSGPTSPPGQHRRTPMHAGP